MDKITVLLPEAEIKPHIIDICSDSTKFGVSLGLAPFDKIHVLPGPHREPIFLKQAQGNSKPIGFVHILPKHNNAVVKFEAESPSADFDEFARLVIGYFQELNLLAEIPAEPAEAQLAPFPEAQNDKDYVIVERINSSDVTPAALIDAIKRATEYWTGKPAQPTAAGLPGHDEKAQETLTNKYDELCKRWVTRPSVPYMNKSEFLAESAPELLSKSFDRILSDAFNRGVIDKTPGKYGRYKPKV